jgi:hypothetical protein
VRKRFGIHGAARHLLQPIVADGCRRGQSFIDVARLEEVPRGGGATPNACVAVGLQLETDGVFIRVALIALHHFLRAIGRA